MNITVSAPGKLMLFGEHAVVYGYPCIVTAVGQRMRTTVDLLDTPDFIVDAQDVDIISYKKKMTELGIGAMPKGVQFVEIALANFSKKYQLQPGIHITMTSEFSSQFGFGSSSASTVCVIQACAALMGINISKKELFDLSYQTVLDIQKTGSGFDVAAAVYGGILYYLTGGKVIEPLAIKNISFVVGYSGSKSDTPAMIADVAWKREREKVKVERIFEAIATLTDDAKKKMEERDWERVGTLMNFNQEYLRDLGVSTEKLEAMIAAAKQVGAWGAKLSGAGGGDCMIALAPSDKRKVVEEAVIKAGGQVIDVSVSAEGVKIEKPIQEFKAKP